MERCPSNARVIFCDFGCRWCHGGCFTSDANRLAANGAQGATAQWVGGVWGLIAELWGGCKHGWKLPYISSTLKTFAKNASKWKTDGTLQVGLDGTSTHAKFGSHWSKHVGAMTPRKA